MIPRAAGAAIVARARPVRRGAGRAAERRRRAGGRSWWHHLRADDLYLAMRVRARRRRRASIASSAATATRSGAPRAASSARAWPADDLVQLLRAKLFTRRRRRAPAPEQRPRIASYTGQGFLQNWVRVTATRTFIDCCRGLHRVARGPDPQRAGRRAARAAGADPELQLLKREHLAHFKAAFAEAAAALDASHGSSLLKQHLVERLTIDQIGGALSPAPRVGGAADRQGARGAARRDAHRAGAPPGLPPERLGSVLELVASRLEASIERLLG